MFSTRLGLDAFSLHTIFTRLNKVALDEISVRSSHTVAVHKSYAPKVSVFKMQKIKYERKAIVFSLKHGVQLQTKKQ